MLLGKKVLSDQKGQTLLVIVLVMVVALTVGLSIATRTIVNLRTTSDQANSQKALSAAEAGVEESIKTGSSIAKTNFPIASGVNVSYTTNVNPVDGTVKFLLNGGTQISQHDAVYVWVTPYMNNFSTTWSGHLTVYWGDASASTNCNVYSPPSPYNPTPAIEVAVVYGSKTTPNIQRYAFDPCGAPRTTSNHFDSSGITTGSNKICTGDNCQTLKYSRTIDLTTTPVLLVRVNPIYTDSYIGAQGDNNLPGQGSIIDSTGTTDQSTRKISVYEGYPEIPSEFFPVSFWQR